MQVSRQPLNISPDLAQRMADIIQKPVELVIENKPQEPAGNGDNNTEKKKDFTRIFYPHKNTEG